MSNKISLSYKEISAIYDFVNKQDNKRNPNYEIELDYSSAIGTGITIRTYSPKFSRIIVEDVTDYSRW